MSNEQVNEHFFPRLDSRWNRVQTGGGRLLLHHEGLRLLTVGATSQRYADAQIDDYTGLSRRHFPWRSPLRLTVRARASGELRGTAGFGFWNNPFSPLGGVPALPAAAWFFFASPPSNLPLASGVSGHGWKCATIDATSARALRWAPLAPAVLLLNRSESVARELWPRVQRDLAIAEAPIPNLDSTWRSYGIDWHSNHVGFSIDGELVLETPHSPRGPLGFVAWVDNQFAIATPKGQFGWGLLDAPQPQSLDLAHIEIQKLKAEG